MPLRTSQTYISLDDEKLIMGNEISTISANSQFADQIKEILTLPKDMLNFKNPSTYDQESLSDEIVMNESIIKGKIENPIIQKVGYRHLNTGKYLGEEREPGREPRYDVRFDGLNFYKRYKTANKNSAVFNGYVTPMDISIHFGQYITKLLGMKLYMGTERYKYLEERAFLDKQDVLYGNIDDQDDKIYRHVQSGLCIGKTNGGPIGDYYYDTLHKLRIEPPFTP